MDNNNLEQIVPFAIYDTLNLVATDTAFTRNLYHQGINEIAATRVKLFKLEGVDLPDHPTLEQLEKAIAEKKIPKAKVEVISKTLSNMRHDLAHRVRGVSSQLTKSLSEYRDSMRGKSRLKYEGMRKTKTPVEIIISSTKTDSFSNFLPKFCKWTGRGFLFVSAAFSFHVIITATPENREYVIEEELNSWMGGFAGGVVGEVIVSTLQIEAWGVILIVVLVSSIAGGILGREVNLLQLLDIAPHFVPNLVGKLYFVDGDWEIIDLFLVTFTRKEVNRNQRIIVLCTGRKSGLMIGGRGHYRMLEVIAASNAADKLFKEYHKDNYLSWVPENLLFPVEEEDLIATVND